MNKRDIVEQTIASLQQAVDETKKADSIRRIERIIGQIDTEILDHELVTGLDDLETAIEEYKGIERGGLTPEEYREEKESAFEAITEAVNGLDIDEDALEEIEEEEIEKPRPPVEPMKTTRKQIMEMDYNHTLDELKKMAREKGVSPSGTKHEIIRRLLS